MPFPYIPEWNVTGQGYWLGIAYVRGFTRDDGWEAASKNIPDVYKELAKEAYDKGRADYADSLEKYPLDYERYGHVAAWREEMYAGLDTEVWERAERGYRP